MSPVLSALRLSERGEGFINGGIVAASKARCCLSLGPLSRVGGGNIVLEFQDEWCKISLGWVGWLVNPSTMNITYSYLGPDIHLNGYLVLDEMKITF